MKKNVKKIYISLNTNKTFPIRNKSPKLMKELNPSLKENKTNQNSFIFNKKKLNKNNIPNSYSKFYTKKTNNNINKQKEESYKNKQKLINNSFAKKNQSDTKRQSLSIIKKNKNSPLRLSNQVKITPEKNKSLTKNKSQLNLPNYKNPLNSQRFLKNNYNLKSKKISIFKDKKSSLKKDNKNIPNKNSKEEPPIYHKKIEKSRKLIWINKIKNNIINISSDNVKKNISLYNQPDNSINKSQVIGTIKNNINLNNKEIITRNIYFPRSPKNYSISFKNNISPIKKVNLTKNKNNDKTKKIKISSDIKILHLENKLPNNYAYHEIVYKNSPKKILTNINIKEKERYDYIKETQRIVTLRNERPLLEELITPNNKRISTTILITNKSFNSSDKKSIPYFCTLNNNTNFTLKSSFQGDNFNNFYTNENICLCSEDNIKILKNNRKLFLSPKNKKLDISGQYNEIDTENEDIQTIQMFGEKMLERNKNYNFNKVNETYKFSIDELKNKEFRRNNSSNDINNEQENKERKEFKSISFSHSLNEGKWKKYQKRNENKIGSIPINKNNKRYNHNIINRKKNKKLIMEKSLNEQFISKSNRNKSNENTKDKISCCESSINLDNDSINDIIKEFENEIEKEEQKDKASKNSSQKKIINNSENNDYLIYSFASENDNLSNMSKGSTNDSKVKKRKVRYYKTKNYDMEKNYDFCISSTKKRKTKK